MSEFILEAVHCKSCGSGLVVEVNDNITYCSSCGNGFEIIGGELIPIEINFAAPALRGEGEMIYKPFWLMKSNVNIVERKAGGKLLRSLFGDSHNSSSGDLTFYIPAFHCSLDTIKNLATQFTMKHPVASPQKYNVKLLGFAYTKEDAKKFAEFILISLEAERGDIMKNFNYELKFNTMEILGVPFYKTMNGYKDAVLGLEI
jgi:hypothetical protein